MTRPPVVFVVLALASAAGCSGGGGGQNPIAPSAITEFSNGASRSVLLPRGDLGPSAVTFPQRSDVLDLLRGLEQIYQTSLFRAAGTTYVDPEGTAVWLQEYLRFRVNLCSDADAVAKVMSEIDGGPAAPVCGVTNTAVFPPQNESAGFMLQLESKYQNGLKRPAMPTYLDDLGTAVWMQEYLRYRTIKCAHSEAFEKVRQQIYGNGVQPGCEPGVGLAGYWDGTYSSGGGFTMSFTQPEQEQPRGILVEQGVSVFSSSTGNNFRFTASYLTLSGEWIGTWDGGDTITGTASGSLTKPGGFVMRRRR